MASEEAFGLVVGTLKELAAEGSFPEHLVAAEILPSTEISALGLDSYSKMLFLAEIEARSQVKLHEREMEQSKTVGDIVDALEATLLERNPTRISGMVPEP